MAISGQTHSQKTARAVPGAPAALAALVALVAGIVLLQVAAIAGVVVLVLDGIALMGFVIVQPNSSCVLILFGRYTGTAAEPGPWWVNPFTRFWRRTVSLRVRNFQSERIKVNDGVEPDGGAVGRPRAHAGPQHGLALHLSDG